MRTVPHHLGPRPRHGDDVGHASFDDCALGLVPLTGVEVVIHAPEVVGRGVVVVSEKTGCARARSRHCVER